MWFEVCCLRFGGFDFALWGLKIGFAVLGDVVGVYGLFFSILGL